MASKTNHPRVRVYGNDTIDSMPDLTQEWYHAVGTPYGLGNFPWVNELKKKGVDINSRIDAYGSTALFLAVEQHNLDMVKHLIETVGVDKDILDYGGFNALDYAAACHCHHKDYPGSGASIDIASYLQGQGLRYTWLGAAMAEDIDRLCEFLENGQDIDERSGHFNKTAMEEALENGGYWTAKLLEVKGATAPYAYKKMNLTGALPNIVSLSRESECTAATQGKLAK